ncbi:HEAT repeat domain-containing protein [Halorussus gelatinilyticus]|uniref:HEAT repeat domain-containing protein n=1 Tax=Halorussus gelatinilyticus TaxID=2937524 RepID=A0A8U0IK06_9EURY|nr:HEAT repeat domain-containing protein [Halorussus gelatinilyticus]UPW01403.1 HEAT repeat domain-containing protein [Halorussus gelatinilyticus]
MSNEYKNRSARARSPLRGSEATEEDGADGEGDDEASLRSLLDSPCEYERRDAALALVDEAESEGLDAETARALADRLAVDDSADVRQFAVEALGVAGPGTPADVETAVRGALDDGDEWVRAEAVVALSRVAPDADPIADALDDDSGWVRRNAVIALGKTERATFEDLTDRIKNDAHPAVREYAARYLGECAERDDSYEADAVRLLAAVLARDPEAFVRAKAAEALGGLATDRAEQALETHGITDRSDDVKRTAKRALASARGVDPDQLDVEIDDGPPGGGPQTPGETPGGPGPGGGPGGGPNSGPGSGPNGGTGRPGPGSGPEGGPSGGPGRRPPEPGETPGRSPEDANER